MRWCFCFMITVFFTVSFWSLSASAACPIEIQVTNLTSTPMVINPPSSRSKQRGGTWRRLTKGGWFHTERHCVIAPGETVSDTYTATGNCERRRRFEISAHCLYMNWMGAGSHNRTFPTGGGFTRVDPVPVTLTDPTAICSAVYIEGIHSPVDELDLQPCE